MVFRWRRWWRGTLEQLLREQILHDAQSLIAQFGDGAYDEARKRAIDARTRDPVDPHWDKVRREIGRRIGRVHLDTATRYTGS